LTQELLSQYTPFIDAITLHPSSGGRFEVTVDGDLIFSKKGSGKHAQPGEIANLLEDRFGFIKMAVD